jgi:hypothetical protein
MWTVPEAKGIAITSKLEDAQINLSSDNYPKLVSKYSKLLFMSHIMLRFFGYCFIIIISHIQL